LREPVVERLRLAAAFSAFGSSESAFFRDVRVRFGLASAAGSASALAVPSSSCATPACAAVLRRRAGFVRFGSSGDTERLGGGGSTAGGAAGTRAMARDGSGAAFTPVA